MDSIHSTALITRQSSIPAPYKDRNCRRNLFALFTRAYSEPLPSSAGKTSFRKKRLLEEKYSQEESENSQPKKQKNSMNIFAIPDSCFQHFVFAFLDDSFLDVASKVCKIWHKVIQPIKLMRVSYMSPFSVMQSIRKISHSLAPQILDHYKFNNSFRFDFSSSSNQVESLMKNLLNSFSDEGLLEKCSKQSCLYGTFTKQGKKYIYIAYPVHKKEKITSYEDGETQTYNSSEIIMISTCIDIIGFPQFNFYFPYLYDNPLYEANRAENTSDGALFVYLNEHLQQLKEEQELKLEHMDSDQFGNSYETTFTSGWQQLPSDVENSQNSPLPSSASQSV